MLVTGCLCPVPVTGCPVPSANEPVRQLCVPDLPPEPFTDKQQRQSRMDGSVREHVPQAPPIVQPYLEKERNRAAAENRLPRTGAAAYREVPITGAFQAIFPWFRQRFSFGCLSEDPAGVPQPACRGLDNIFALGEDGQVESILNASGEPVTPEDLAADGQGQLVGWRLGPGSTRRVEAVARVNS